MLSYIHYKLDDQHNLALDTVLLTTRLSYTPLSPEDHEELKSTFEDYVCLLEESRGMLLPKLDAKHIGACLDGLSKDAVQGLELLLVIENRMLLSFYHKAQEKDNLGLAPSRDPNSCLHRSARGSRLEQFIMNMLNMPEAGRIQAARQAIKRAHDNGTLSRTSTSLTTHPQMLAELSADTLYHMASDSDNRLMYYRQYKDTRGTSAPKDSVDSQIALDSEEDIYENVDPQPQATSIPAVQSKGLVSRLRDLFSGAQPQTEVVQDRKPVVEINTPEAQTTSLFSFSALLNKFRNMTTATEQPAAKTRATGPGKDAFKSIVSQFNNADSAQEQQDGQATAATHQLEQSGTSVKTLKSKFEGANAQAPAEARHHDNAQAQEQPASGLVRTLINKITQMITGSYTKGQTTIEAQEQIASSKDRAPLQSLVQHFNSMTQDTQATTSASSHKIEGKPSAEFTAIVDRFDSTHVASPIYIKPTDEQTATTEPTANVRTLTDQFNAKT